MFKSLEECIKYSVYKAGNFPRAIEIPWLLEQITPITTKSGIYKRILDIGCCWSGLPFYLAKCGFDVTGIDILSMKDNLTEHNPQPQDKEFLEGGINFNFIQCNTKELPFEDNSFDIIYSISVIEHLNNKFYDYWYDRHNSVKEGKGDFSYEDWKTKCNFGKPKEDIRKLALSEMYRVAKDKIILTFPLLKKEDNDLVSLDEFNSFPRFTFDNLAYRKDLLEKAKEILPKFKPINVTDIGVVICK